MLNFIVFWLPHANFVTEKNPLLLTFIIDEIMETCKRLFWLVAAMIVLVTSCGDKNDEPNAVYNYYMLIQSEVTLELSDNAEEEGTLVGGQVSVISRTVSKMRSVVAQYESDQSSTGVEAALLTACDSIYREYSSAYVQYSGQTLCYVQIVRRKMVNGEPKEGTTLKTYYFRALKDVEPSGSGDPTPPEFSLNKPEALEAVDLGLSVMWANCNLGAKSPEDYGGYFGWGDPTGMLWDGNGIYKQAGAFVWNTDNYGGMNPPTEIGGTSLDVVTAHWGAGWRTPSGNEAYELCSKCEWKLRSQDGRNWYEVIGPNGNSIIIPLAGIYGILPRKGSSLLMEGPLHTNSSGWYWTSTICDTPGTSQTRGYAVKQGVATAWMFVCDSSRGDLTGLNMFNEHLRAFHMSIRPIYIKSGDIQPN